MYGQWWSGLWKAGDHAWSVMIADNKNRPQIYLIGIANSKARLWCRCSWRVKVWAAGGTWRSTCCSHLANQSGFRLLALTMPAEGGEIVSLPPSCCSPYSPLRYIVKLRETIHVEEDPTNTCQNYPNNQFDSYRWIRNCIRAPLKIGKYWEISRVKGNLEGRGDNHHGFPNTSSVLVEYKQTFSHH